MPVTGVPGRSVVALPLGTKIACVQLNTPYPVPLWVNVKFPLVSVVDMVLPEKFRLSTASSVDTVIFPVESAIVAAAVPSLALILVTS